MDRTKYKFLWKSIYFLILPAVLSLSAGEPTFAAQAGSQPIIVIDPGHGGVDDGAAVGSVKEKDITLGISQKLREYLADEGYKPVLTRSKDISLYKTSRESGTTEKKDLNARTNIINSSGAQLYLSVHVNSYTKNPGFNGSIVYYNDSVKGSKDLAEYIQKALNKVTLKGKPRTARNTEAGNFYILKNSKIPGVLIETAFITNSQERELLISNSFKAEIAKAIVKGVDGYRLLKSGMKGNYIAFLYGKNSSLTEKKYFSTPQQSYQYVQSKSSNGIIYSAASPNKTIGVVLEGCAIEFAGKYTINANANSKAPDVRVKAIQKRLAYLGYKISVDGYAGTGSLNAIKKFQGGVHLEPDGIVGRQTFEKLVCTK